MATRGQCDRTCTVPRVFCFVARAQQRGELMLFWSKGDPSHPRPPPPLAYPSKRPQDEVGQVSIRSGAHTARLSARRARCERRTTSSHFLRLASTRRRQRRALQGGINLDPAQTV